MSVRTLLLVVGFLTCSLDAFADAGPGNRQEFAKFSDCRLLSGESIAPCRVAYRTLGTLNADKTNAVLVPTWFTGTSAEHEYLASAELIDPDRYFVIIVDAFANGVSSSPSNSETQGDGRFPVITIADMVIGQHRLLTEVFELSSLHAVVGLSMGGMQAFEWAVRYPGFPGKVVAAIGSPRLPAYDIASWTSRIRLLAMFRACQCVEALEAMAGIGMTYAVPARLELEIGRQDVIETITERGKARLESITVGKTWDEQRQAEAMIGHNVAREFDDDMQRAAARVKSDILVIVGADDRVVTPGPSREFAALVDGQFIELDEDCGHGDPWCAAEAFATLVRGFLDGPGSGGVGR